MAQDGAAGPNSIRWTSRYGSVIAAAFEACSADGMNEKGLVVDLLSRGVQLSHARRQRCSQADLRVGLAAIRPR